MGLDDTVRVEGIDYSSDSWTIDGVTYTEKAAADIAAAALEAKLAAAIAARGGS